jgi:dienelactone hydrolase
VVLFAHGSGSGRLSPRNRLVAARLQQAGLATLLLDLLTAEEKKAERAGGRLRFDVQLLAGRLAAARRLEELADHCQRIATRSSSDPVARRSPTGWCP